MDIEIARACVAHTAKEGGATVIDPRNGSDAEWVGLIYSVMKSIVRLVPSTGGVFDAVDSAVRDASESISVTVPTPAGPLVILSKAAVSDGVELFSVGLHECVHVSQINDHGGIQSGIDYLCGELRGFREAEASGVGMWARFVVTGKMPRPEDASVLTSSLYHLSASEKSLSLGGVRSVLGTASMGLVPPFRAAISAINWLRKHSPESILVSDFR